MVLSLSLFGCDDPSDSETEQHTHDHDHNDESEVMTRLELAFAPDDGATPVVAEFSDPDGDGGVSGTADPIVLRPRTSYELRLRVFNDLVDPPEDVTIELREEAEEHQVFFAGDAIGRTMTVVYGDTESMYADDLVGDDLPVGLVSSVTTLDSGTGSLLVQLQHLPDLNGEPVKVPGLEDRYPDLPGWPDLVVTFDLDVEG